MKDFRSLEHKIRDVMIAEQEARNTAIRRKMSNVGRPDDNVKDETSKLAKQGEIKTKVIDEASPDQQTDGAFMKDKDKGDKATKKKPDAQDEDDPREVKGGKTEVDLKPTTDDSTEDSTKEDETSKKAKAKVNKEIGAKGVKEHTMTGTHFGLPQSLIDTVRTVVEAKVNEKLVGNQHKIDANKNGKVDAHDFKLLKGKKKVEEAHGSSDGKTATGTKWSDSSVSVSVHHNGKKDVFTGKHDYVAKKLKAQHGMSIHDVNFKKASDMKEEVEQIDELSKGTVSSYKEKSDSELNKKAPVGPGSAFKNRMKREKGNFLANKKLGGKAKVNATEETDPGFSEAELARLEEISKGL